jgi:hypothetical protein
MFYVNTIGAQLKPAFVLNNAGFPNDYTPMNIYGLTAANVFLIKPSGTITAGSGTLYTDGSDGILLYTTVAGDLDEAGLYELQGRIYTPSGDFYNSVTYFQVLEPL